jgi:hypothetical protein
MATERQSRNAATHGSCAGSDPIITVADYCQHAQDLSIFSVFLHVSRFTVAKTNVTD